MAAVPPAWRRFAGRVREMPGEAAAAAGVGLFLAAVAMLVALSLWMDRREALEAGATRAANMSRLLDEQTRRTFQSVELALQDITAAIERSPGLPEHDAAFEDSLREKLNLLPNVRALFFIGPDGFITQDTDHPLTPRVSLADRAYFRAQAADPNLGLYIGSPLRSRSVSRWFVSVSRRMNRPDGSFGGIAVAAVEPAYYEAFLRELRLGPQDSIALFHKDGTLIARTPNDLGKIGLKMTQLPLFARELPNSPSGVFQGASEQFDGRRRIVSYRILGDFPLVVTVALDRESMLAGWRRNALVASGLSAVLCTAAIVFASIWMRRRRDRRQARHRALVLQKLRALGQMAGSTAHDFNNVLAVVEAGLHLIDRNAEDPAKVRALAQEARDATARATGLVSQLQAFARGQEMELRPYDAADLLRRLEPMLQRTCGGAVALRLELGADPLPCAVDRMQFDSAMMNLVVNARDAMPGGGEIRISAGRAPGRKDGADARFAADHVRIFVEDQGEGMTEDVRRRIFDPFFTTKGEKGGTGLGLAQVYGFMQQIGGEVRVRSRLGKGTTFELLLPCPKPDAAPQAGAPQTGAAPSATAARAQKRAAE